MEQTQHPTPLSTDASMGCPAIYAVNAEQAEQINRRRTDGVSIARAIGAGRWPKGAQAHIGNKVEAGDEFPMIIVRVWSADLVNGQVFLDGNDTLWVTSVTNGRAHGCWRWRTTNKTIED